MSGELPRAAENEPEMIEAALQGEGRWPSGLEALYEVQSGPTRREAVERTTRIGGAVTLACCGFDAWVDPGLFWRGLPWRLAVFFLALGCAKRLRRCAPSSRPGGAEWAWTVTPQLTMMMVTEFIGEYSGRYGDRYMMAAAFGLANFASITPLRLTAARWLCAAAIASYPIVPALLPLAAPLGENSALVLFAACMFATSLFVVRRNERARRRSFLLRRRHDIAGAELNVMNAELVRLSTIDPLTGLHNRRAFTQTLEAHWQDRRQSIGLIIFDVDWFKAFNDSAGHAAGDAALQEVARAVERAIRRGVDMAARIGGEEFAVIMPGADPEQATAFAERLRREVLALQLPHPGRPGQMLSISAGVACCTQADRVRQTPATIMHDADIALYAAKAAGRDRVILSDALTGVPSA